MFKRTYVCSIMFRLSEYEAVRKRRTDTPTAIQLSDSARVFTPRHMRHRNAYPKKNRIKDFKSASAFIADALLYFR